MKKFEFRELKKAIEFSLQGGQALHLHQIIADEFKAPRCFVAAIRRGESIAHLFDQDEFRLVATVEKLGVRQIKVDRPGTERQHIDLCAGPLKHALYLCEN